MREAPRRLVLPSDLSSVARASEWLRGLGEEALLAEDDIYRLDLCAGELLANIVGYAFEDGGPHAIELSVRLKPGEVLLEIDDDGRAFDPVTHRLGPSATMSEDVAPGGWGLRLVRRFADECRYERCGDRNRNSLRIRRHESPAPAAAEHSRGLDRRQRADPVVFPLKRADGSIAMAEDRTGGDRRLLGFISRFEIFRGIPFGLVERAIARCNIMRYADGTVLLEPGQRNDSVAFVLSGRLRVHLDSPESANFFVIDVGDCAGEFSVIDGKPVSAYVVADAGCRVLLVDGETLLGPLFAIPEVARKFMAILTERLRRTSERMLEQQRAAMEFAQLQRDLRLAHEIQLGMLPQESTLFADRPEVDVATGIRVARQVGGDFYDAFFVDQTHLFLMIGDVCGKGLPAALFMVRTMTLLRSEAARRDRSKRHALPRMMERVNQVLVERNDASLFATVFCALLDTASGRLVYVNGGHCPPLLAAPGGAYAPIVDPRNTVVGIVEDVAFTSGELQLAAGSTLVFYTDGVTEALSTSEEEFGIGRLMDTIGASERSAAAVVPAIFRAVESFAGTAPQSDDIAVLAATWLGLK